MYVRIPATLVVVLAGFPCRYKGLGPEEMLLYQQIKSVGNSGACSCASRKCVQVKRLCIVVLADKSVWVIQLRGPSYKGAPAGKEHW